MKMRTLGLLAAAVAGLAFSASGTKAATLYVSDGTTLVTATDAGTPGSAVIAGPLGTWQLVVTTSFTKPIVGSATSPTLQTNITATRNGGGDLWITWTDTGFGPYSAPLNISDSLTSTEASVVETYQVFGNSANTIAVMNAAGSLGGTAGVQIGSTANLAGGGGGSASANSSANTSGLTSPYALTQFIHISTSAQLNTTLGASANVAPVPVPAAAWMGLSTLAGMGGLGVLRRRARKA